MGVTDAGVQRTMHCYTLSLIKAAVATHLCVVDCTTYRWIVACNESLLFSFLPEPDHLQDLLLIGL